MSKIVKSVGFLGSLLRRLLNSFPLMKNVFKPLAKSVLIPLVLTVAVSTADATILKNIFGSGMTPLIISIDEMEYIIQIVKSPKKSVLLIKGVSKTLTNEAKE